jgi:MFS family permease
MGKNVLQSNLKVAYILAFLGELYFPTAIWLFFLTKYLNFKEIALISSCGYIASILFEIPTGAFADVVGRKVAIIISYFIFSVTMLFTGFSHSFFAFFILTIIGALGDALYSGSLEALVYDTLKENKEESHFEFVTSRMQTLSWIGLFVGSIIGGFLFAYWFRFPYIVQAIITCIAGLISFKLIEPKIDTKKYKLSQFITQNTQGFREIFKSISVTHISLSLITIGIGYQVSYSILGISQAKEYGISPQYVGILFAAGYIISALASHVYPLMKKRIGAKFLLLLSTSLLLSSFFFAKYVGVYIGALLIFLRIASSTTFRNTRSIQLNRFFSSKNRATALSTVNLLTNLPYAILAYFIGDYIDKHSPNSFAFVLGSILLILLLGQNIFFYVLNKRNTLPNKS